MQVIKTVNLTKKYPSKLAVDNVSMNVYEGDIYGLIGRNGVGKTSTMKLLLGLTKPTSGSIELFESKNLDKGRRSIGSLIEAPGIYKNCSAYENLKRFEILTGGSQFDLNELLTIVGLDKVGNRKAGSFSLGMKQRLGIAIALLGNPRLLILDEPINGLDPEGIKEIREVLLKLNKEYKVTIVISSHLLDELAKITTRYGIINNGVLVEEIEASTLMKRCTNKLIIKTDSPALAVSMLVKSFKLQNIKDTKDSVIIEDDIDKSNQYVRCLVENKINVFECWRDMNGFEDYFIERIGR